MAKTLLVADDSVTIQKVINLTFADENVRIESVSDGIEAIESAKRLRPDVVLADVCMPGCTGYEVCEAIKHDPDLSHIPVILLVGTFEPYDETEAARVKSDGYLTKPFETLELIRLVHSFIDHEERARPPAEQERPAEAGLRRSLPPPPNTAVSSRTRESFLGPKMILDLFGAELISRITAPPPISTGTVRGKAGERDGSRAGQPYPRAGTSAPDTVHPFGKSAPSSARQVIPFPGAREASVDTAPVVLTEEMIHAIVEKIVRRISLDVVRDIVWEVVPEMSDTLIRQYLRDHGPAGKG